MKEEYKRKKKNSFNRTKIPPPNKSCILASQKKHLIQRIVFMKKKKS